MGRMTCRAAEGAGGLEGVLSAPEPGWRTQDPGSGSVIAAGVRIYHDAGLQNVLVSRPATGLLLTVYQFDGSYLSLAVDVPGAVRGRLRPGWRLAAELTASASRPVTTFLRLNLESPSGGQALHEVVVVETGPRTAVFALDAVNNGWSSAWLDIIFSHPRMAEIHVQGLSLNFQEVR